MYRNLSKRVEVVAPILAAEPKEKLWKVLDTCLRDRRQAWALGPDGHYKQLSPEGPEDAPESLGVHRTLMELARRKSE
jgi:polyphosphate kinase